ncbi:hypothetical protein B0A52_04254 [Exophiala mesophila]|uniref:NADH dehydrogenase [ubiquinone] 1 beta subcomplex subunit 8, mitochondrial n=1 Tax=Exophiala mesophila TaxID=212818 RepID=A0A438N7W5_EXOME|nr:hypothetical protein B0A52_04254 [Exophiala mesophila]
MLSRQALSLASRSTRAAMIRSQARPIAPFSTALGRRAGAELDDPEMNGNYINPPRIKRQHRDPYGDWDDPQERRNFGEPVHEDNEILGIFALEDYTHMTPARGALLWAGFLGCIGALSAFVYATFPGKPAVPVEYEDGLEKELGGPAANLARKPGAKVEL